MDETPTGIDPISLSPAEFERRLVEGAIWYDGAAIRLTSEVKRAEEAAADFRRRLIEFRYSGRRT